MADQQATSTRFMEKLKENPGVVAVGLAAIATAGYLFYKKVSGKNAVTDAESVTSAEEER